MRNNGIGALEKTNKQKMGKEKKATFKLYIDNLLILFSFYCFNKKVLDKHQRLKKMNNKKYER